MPNREDIHYFGAGPAALPTSVLQSASQAILNYNNTGLGLIEQSHRNASSSTIVNSAASNLLKLLGAPDDGSYTAIFMQGGGTTQFSAVVYNLLGYWVQKQLDASNGDTDAVKKRLGSLKADYLITGTWSSKAATEASRLIGPEHVNVAIDVKKSDGKFGNIPAEGEWTLTDKESSLYTYYCDNETVDGVEFPGFPGPLDSERLMVADMSSNILSRRLDITKYALIFAGAQKNVGGAGVTMVVVRSEILKTQPSIETVRKLGLPIAPIMMDYAAISKAGSLYNTLPIFDVFICGEVMKGLLERGGIEVQERVAGKKAKRLYGALEKSAIYKVVPRNEVKSRMNICFRIEGTDDVEKEFLKGAEDMGLLGLKGHRSVGGLRISNYNSITEKDAEKLAAYIEEFAKRG